MAKEIHEGGSEDVILLRINQNLSEPAAIWPLVELAYGVCSDVGWRCEDEEQVYPRTRRKRPKLAHRAARDGHSRIRPQGWHAGQMLQARCGRIPYPSILTTAQAAEVRALNRPGLMETRDTRVYATSSPSARARQYAAPYSVGGTSPHA
jgi:hypothetical protein